MRTLEDRLDLWLIQGAERFGRDKDLRRALLAIARHPNSRNCLVLLHGILETPELAERLLQVLRPELEPQEAGAGERAAKRNRKRRSS